MSERSGAGTPALRRRTACSRLGRSFRVAAAVTVAALVGSLGLGSVLPASAASDLAAQVVGNWTLDANAARSEVATTLDKELMALPEDERQSVRDGVMAALERLLEELGTGLRLEPGGKASIRERGREASARWTAEEEFVRIEKTRPVSGDVPLLGMVEGDTLWIEPDDSAQDVLPIPLRRE